MWTMKLTVVITMSINTESGVSRKPMLNVSNSVNFSHVKLNTVTVGYKPVEASRPTAKKYSYAVYTDIANTQPISTVPMRAATGLFIFIPASPKIRKLRNGRRSIKNA